VNIAVHFIRARSNLILRCSSSLYIFAIYWEREGGEGQDIGERERRESR